MLSQFFKLSYSYFTFYFRLKPNVFRKLEGLYFVFSLFRHLCTANNMRGIRIILIVTP